MTDSLKLESKGPVVPPPVLAEPMQSVSAEIPTWPGIIAATHWQLYRPTEVDGADFYVGEAELGHIHLDGEVHLATSLEQRRTLVAAGLARPFPYYESWVETSIKSTDDAARALRLFKLNYDRLRDLKRASED